MKEADADILTRAEARLGTTLRGKYRLDRVLGIGGMAVVYKATHRNQAEFALKMLHPEVSLSADIRARFLREGFAANSIKHPGAVVVVDEDVSEDGAAFLVMELLQGTPCDALWAQSERRLSAKLASAIVIQLLDVLAAAHVKGIIHRDIKPANLFLTRAGLVKVLDFGIARAREALVEGSHATGTGMMLGTPAFMSPEHARGRTRELDGRTDIWAAGATFFSLVSGQLVHTGAETVNELLISAATVPARSIAQVAPEIPAAVSAVIDRALAFQKEARWPTAEAMRDALTEAHQTCFGTAPSDSVVAAALRAHETTAAVDAAAPTATPEAPRAQTTRTAPLPELAPESPPNETRPPQTRVESSAAYGASARSVGSRPVTAVAAPAARSMTPMVIALAMAVLLGVGGVLATRTGGHPVGTAPSAASVLSFPPTPPSARVALTAAPSVDPAMPTPMLSTPAGAASAAPSASAPIPRAIPPATANAPRPAPSRPQPRPQPPKGPPPPPSAANPFEDR